MAETKKRNLIQTTFPFAGCMRVKGRYTHFIVYITQGPAVGVVPMDSIEMVAVGKNPSQAWAKAYEKLKEEGRLQ